MWLKTISGSNRVGSPAARGAAAPASIEPWRMSYQFADWTCTRRKKAPGAASASASIAIVASPDAAARTVDPAWSPDGRWRSIRDSPSQDARSTNTVRVADPPEGTWRWAGLTVTQGRYAFGPGVAVV